MLFFSAIFTLLKTIYWARLHPASLCCYPSSIDILDVLVSENIWYAVYYIDLRD